MYMESLFRVGDYSRPWNYNECNRKNHREKGRRAAKKETEKKMMCSISRARSGREKSSKAEEGVSRAGTVFSRHISG